MNFLAHLLLTNGNEDFTIGNFIADSVKSSQWENYNSEVVKGIRIHHKIDTYTDNHQIVERTRNRLRPKHGKYSSVISDIVYDHFLAYDFEKYSAKSLKDFTEACYKLFKRRYQELPPRVQHMLVYMERGDWLYNYKSKDGLNSALSGMGRRASFSNKMSEAADDVFDNYKSFKADFEEFFPQLQLHIKNEIERMHDFWAIKKPFQGKAL